MAVVIHTIKDNQYAYEHHRVGDKVVCDYLGRAGGGYKMGRGESWGREYQPKPSEVTQHPETEYKDYKGIDDNRIKEYIRQTPEEDKERFTKEYEEKLRSNPERYKELLSYDEKVARGETSKTQNSEGNEYHPRRIELHNRIIDELTENKTTQKQPEVVFFGGATASGKSRLMDYVKGKGTNYVYINNDEVKKKLPEYKGTAAGYVHDEARDITDRILIKAGNSRANIIIDSTLRNPEKSKILFDEFRKKGYKVVLLSNIVPLETSLNRATNRFLNPGEEGRYVPVKRIISEHDKTNRSQFELIKYADSGKIFNSDVEKSEPLKVIISKR